MNEDRAITVVEASPAAGPITTQSGTLALAMMSDQEFEARLAALKKGQERQVRVQRELMTEGVDFGVIPGTGNKPTLLKPGAEKLCNLYGLIPEFKHERFVGDGETAPVLQFITTCYLHAGHDGPVAGMGAGEANSWEKKHRYRTAERACPKCGNLGTVRHSKDRDGWYCWAKIGGCGATFPENTPEIKDQQLGQVENPDPYDLANTLVKMSSKRAYVDAALRTTATSGLFTQDLEDMADSAPPARPTAQQPQTPRPAPAAAPARSTAKSNVDDDWTNFWKTAYGLGYSDSKAVLAALNVKNIEQWMAQKDGTAKSALTQLAKLAGTDVDPDDGPEHAFQ